ECRSAVANATCCSQLCYCASERGARAEEGVLFDAKFFILVANVTQFDCSGPMFDTGRLSLSQIAVGLIVGLSVLLGGVFYPLWRQAVDTNRDARADSYHIAGNLYFVGDPAETAFLLTGDKGHVLIGSAGHDAAHKVIDSIEHLGFDIKE